MRREEVVKKVGNTTIRIVPPVLTDEERERRLQEVKHVAWGILKKKMERGRVVRG